MPDDASAVYDAAILGGGVIGLAVLREATLAGLRCVLLESSPDILEGASGSNSGIVCTGVDAKAGTLERALIRDSISAIRPFCRDLNVPTRGCGSLVCLWPWDDGEGNVNVDVNADGDGHRDEEKDDVDENGDGKRRLQAVASESWDAGDCNARILTKEEVQELEPSLSTDCLGAVHIPGEIVLDPWLFSVALASHARENGAVIHTSFRYDPQGTFFDCKTGIWTIARKKSSTGRGSAPSANGETTGVPALVFAKSVINATGIQSDLVQSEIRDAPPPAWEARPRRGQYRIFSPSDVGPVVTRPIQPVRTQRTKGIFVFSTLYDQIVVGPTAVDQHSRTDRTPDAEEARLLMHYATRILPGLAHDAESHHVGEYVGIRPGTTERDYQIHLHPGKHWISAAGIRSTGLTASLGIGRYVVHSFLRVIVPFPLSKDALHHTPRTTPIPSIHDLLGQYHARRDGKVLINKHIYRVTHPLTRMGWEAKTGIAAISHPQKVS